MNLYTDLGYLNFSEIDRVAQRNSVSFIVIIGKRQVGKTFGCIKLFLDNDWRFIFMRRTSTELDMLNRGVNSPFEKVAPDQTIFKPEGKYTSCISRVATDQSGNEVLTRIGMGAALSTIASIRGFNGDPYTELALDEFIPESHLFKIRNEGDAFLNAYTTINGNRELEGRPPLRVWLLANSNNLNSGILDVLHLIPVIERMLLRGEEFKIIKERGIMVILPDSNRITEERKKCALYKAIGGDSNFAKMAYENEFAYNDFSNCHSEPLKEYTAYITVGKITIHIHKSESKLYVTKRVNQPCKYMYDESEKELMKFVSEHNNLVYAFRHDKIVFNSQEIKIIFRNYLKI